MTQPNDWLSGFEARIADMQRKSAQLTESFSAAGATASSPDGAVRVKVGPTGAFEEVQLGPAASRFSPGELAGIINSTAAQAQRVAAEKARAAFASIVDSPETSALIDSFMPPPPEAVSDAPRDGLDSVDEIEEPPQAPPPPAPPVPPAAPGPQRPPTSKKDDDDDFDQPW